MLLKFVGIKETKIKILIIYETYSSESVGDFAERCTIGTYLVTMPNHITTIIDGVVYDTFDCRNRPLWCAWKVE